VAVPADKSLAWSTATALCELCGAKGTADAEWRSGYVTVRVDGEEFDLEFRCMCRQCCERLRAAVEEALRRVSEDP
jgi:hypothetical protein